jgi:AraC-like DNA-binding protein
MKEEEDQKNTNCKRRNSDENLWKSFYLVKDSQQKIDKVSSGVMVVFVIKGNIKVTFDDLESYVVSSKEMFVVQENSSCNMEISKQTHIMTCLLHVETFLSEQALIDELIPLGSTHHELFNKLPINKIIDRYLALLQGCIEDNLLSNSFFDLKRKEFLLLLFAYYPKSDLAQFLQFATYENLQFKEFVMKNFNKVKNVNELAALANYSASGFIKKFQRCFHEPPYEWIQKQRAKQILIEIKNGVKSLQEIAVENKFSSYQHFSIFCKKQFGFPPSEIHKAVDLQKKSNKTP